MEVACVRFISVGIGAAGIWAQRPEQYGRCLFASDAHGCNLAFGAGSAVGAG